VCCIPSSAQQPPILWNIRPGLGQEGGSAGEDILPNTLLKLLGLAGVGRAGNPQGVEDICLLVANTGIKLALATLALMESHAGSKMVKQ
jgi:hypothetical protein